MKTADELKELKEEAETLNRKLHELTDDEMEQVTGGYERGREPPVHSGANDI